MYPKPFEEVSHPAMLRGFRADRRTFFVGQGEIRVTEVEGHAAIDPDLSWILAHFVHVFLVQLILLTVSDTIDKELCTRQSATLPQEL